MTTKRDTLYQFCKDFTDEFEKCEKSAIALIMEYKEHGYSNEECKEILYESGEIDALFSSCNLYEAGLKAFIVDDFVQGLDEDIQMQIIRSCMEEIKGRL